MIDEATDSEIINRPKRSSSLTKLTRNLSNLAIKRSASSSKVKLIQLQDCGSMTLIAHEDRMMNAAPTMDQEPDDDPRPQRKIDAIKIYTFESNYNPKAAPNPMASPILLDKSDERKEVAIHIVPQEKFCRFCFESDENSEKGKLIYPCKCDGSLKHIHENCLKTWIGQRPQSDSSIIATCEICSYAYKLEFKRVLKFSCGYALNEGFSHLLIAVGLTVCLVNLIWMAAKYSPMLLANKSGSNLVLLSLFPIIAIMFLFPLLASLKKAFIEKRVVAVKIYNFDPSQQQPEQPQIQVVRTAGDEILAEIFTIESEGSDESSPQEATTQLRRRQANTVSNVQNQSLNMSQHQLLSISVSHAP